MICVRHVRREEADGGQRHAPRCETLLNHGEASCRSSRFDPVVCRMPGQVQCLCAVGEERGVALTEVEPAGIKFHQERDHFCCRVSLIPHGTMQMIDQGGITELRTSDELFVVMLPV